MIRILHYVGIMNRGGMEMFIMNLYNNIDRNKINFDFAVHGENCGDFEEEIRNLGGNFHNFPHMRKNPLKYRAVWKKFWQQNKEKYQVFHVHTNSLANVIAIDEAAKVNIPVRIIHSHSSFADKGKLQKLNDLLHKINLNRIDKYANVLFTCSDKAADWLFGDLEIKSMKVTELKNGINLTKYKYNSDIARIFRENFKFTNNEKIVGHIGKFITVKNHKFIIEVLENMIKKDSHIRAILIGNGELWEEINNSIKEKKLEEKIFLLGLRSDISELLSFMDMLLFPSLYEGFPVTLVEAQANGLPVLVSDAITKDVKLNENITFMNLNEGSEKWADEALNILQKNNRITDTTELQNAGFDINQTIKLYTDIITKKLDI